MPQPIPESPPKPEKAETRAERAATPPEQQPATQWHLSVFDKRQIPEAFLIVDEKAIKAHLDRAIAEGQPVPTIPGITVGIMK